MSTNEAEFSKKLLSIFKIESQDHLKVINDNLLKIEKELDIKASAPLIEQIFREAHSLKGAARVVNFASIEVICQTLENVLAELKKGTIKKSPFLFDTLYGTTDLISDLIKNDVKEKVDNPRLFELVEKLNKIEEETRISKEIFTSALQSYQSEVNHESVSQEKNEVSPLKTPFEAKDKSSDQPALQKEEDKTIRVSSSKLDLLLQHIEELLVIKLSTAQRLYNFKKLAEQFYSLENESSIIQQNIKVLEKQLQNNESKPHTIPLQKILVSNEDYQKNLKSIRDLLQNDIKLSSQDFRLTNSLIDHLLEETKKVLMQPFSTLFDIFPRMVRDISHDLQKKADIELRGSDIEIDRRILEELKDPFIHLIRNAIDHGIEKPEERKELNKAPEGKIEISVSQISGNSVEVIISDDGKGIDFKGIKEVALAKKIITETEFKTLSDEETKRLIFQSGISTAPIITDLSGRGLGLGIALEKIEKLGGQIFIETEYSKGTTFRILLPLTLATFRGIRIQVAQRDFMIPSQNVKRVIRISQSEIKTVENKETIIWEGRTLSFVDLKAILNIERSSENSATQLLNVLIIKASEITVAVGVDKILNEQEILVKGLGKQLKKVANISGASLTEEGKIIPILDPFDLIRNIGKEVDRNIIIEPTKSEEITQKSILVAEDSVTARILLKNILESAGYDVHTVEDGIEALTFLKTNKIDLLVSDVEMPRMSGFDLTRKIRETENLREIPIILCTSRGSREDREKGIECGANAYIDKSSFSHGILLNIIQKLL